MNNKIMERCYINNSRNNSCNHRLEDSGNNINSNYKRKNVAGEKNGNLVYPPLPVNILISILASNSLRD